MKKISISVFHLNSGSCNGCDIETLMAIRCAYPSICFTKQVKSFQEAEVILLTGILTPKIQKFAKEIFLKDKKAKTIYIGSCSLEGGVFKGSYNQIGPPDKFLAPFLYVPGCPPKPEAILEAIKKASKAKVEIKKHPPSSRFRGKVNFFPEKCIKCLRCLQVCPASALRFLPQNKKLYYEYREDRCVFCGLCEEVCPTQAIKLENDYQEVESKKEKFTHHWLYKEEI